MSELNRKIYNLICDYLDSAEWEKICGVRVWNIDKVAEHTGHSKSYLYKLISTGKIKSFKYNNRVFITYKDVRDLLLRNKNIGVA